MNGSGLPILAGVAHNVVPPVAGYRDVSEFKFLCEITSSGNRRDGWAWWPARRAVRNYNDTGESFFEPPGGEHLVSENASATEPASLLAIFVADGGAKLTTFGH